MHFSSALGCHRGYLLQGIPYSGIFTCFHGHWSWAINTSLGLVCQDASSRVGDMPSHFYPSISNSLCSGWPSPLPSALGYSDSPWQPNSLQLLLQGRHWDCGTTLCAPDLDTCRECEASIVFTLRVNLSEQSLCLSYKCSWWASLHHLSFSLFSFCFSTVGCARDD